MATRNTLLVAAAFVAMMVTVLVYFDDSSKNEVLVSPKSKELVSINEARKAYWSRDLPRAERLYQQIANTDATNINAWGELGNLYYLQARWKEAAKAYTEVTLRLIDKNDMYQIAFLYRLISQMDREQAVRIDERLHGLSTVHKDKP